MKILKISVDKLTKKLIIMSLANLVIALGLGIAGGAIALSFGAGWLGITIVAVILSSSVRINIR
jgi:hypothetical protein